LKILTVIGNRPQFIKAAAVSPRLREVAADRDRALAAIAAEAEATEPAQITEQQAGAAE